MKLRIYTLFAFLALTCMAAPALATNITINDLSSSYGWEGVGKGLEDQETEPGMVNSQVWDLEGFFFADNILSMVGGYDFLNGVDDITSGDIFISTLPEGPKYKQAERKEGGNTSQTVFNTYGYNYVIDLNFPDEVNGEYTYKVYAIDGDTVVKTAIYDENEGSSPWQYEPDYSLNGNMNSSDTAIMSGTFTYEADYNVGSYFEGGTHYILAVCRTFRT